MHGAIQSGVKSRRSLLQHLRLLCDCGAGLQAIASRFCRLVSLLIDADCGMIVWFGLDAQPIGFYHDSAPAELKDLFVTRFDELFFSTEEVSIGTLSASEGPLIGKMLDPELQAAFHRGNIYKYLCEPIGHHHLLDMRAEVSGVGRVVFSAWNPVKVPFTTHHANLLGPVQPMMERALGTLKASTKWQSQSTGNPHLITSLDGLVLKAIDPEAERILNHSHLLRQNVSLVRQVRQAPSFALMLAKALDGRSHAEIVLPVLDGRLVCRASRTKLINASDGDSEAMHISLVFQVSVEVTQIDFVMKQTLSPLQREIALFAMQGGERGECGQRFGVSDEALKKHLRAIFNETGVARWTNLIDFKPASPVFG